VVSGSAELKSGVIFRYPFLWERQARAGETEGRKDRPTVVGLRIAAADGQDSLFLFPITSQQPPKGSFAVEIPDAEKRNAGLDADKRLWVVFDEGNHDVVGRSPYIAPNRLIGRFSHRFFVPLMLEVARRKAEIAMTKRLS
jgi:hypothetical protein